MKRESWWQSRPLALWPSPATGRGGDCGQRNAEWCFCPRRWRNPHHLTRAAEYRGAAVAIQLTANANATPGPADSAIPVWPSPTTQFVSRGGECRRTQAIPEPASRVDLPISLTGSVEGEAFRVTCALAVGHVTSVPEPGSGSPRPPQSVDGLEHLATAHDAAKLWHPPRAKPASPIPARSADRLAGVPAHHGPGEPSQSRRHPAHPAHRVGLLWTGRRIDLDSDRRGRRIEFETRRSAQIGLSSTPFCPPLRWRENPGRDCAAGQRALSHAANASRASSGCCRPTPIRNRSVGPSVSSERNKLAGSRMTPALCEGPLVARSLRLVLSFQAALSGSLALSMRSAM